MLQPARSQSRRAGSDVLQCTEPRKPTLTPSIRYRDETGAALVEFALVLPLLLVVLLGVVDFGRAFNHWIDSTHIANVAARYATVNKNPGAGAVPAQTLQQYTKASAATSELRDAVDVCIAFKNPDGTANTDPQVGDSVTVTVDSTFSWLDFLVGEVGLTDTAITGAATMRLEAKPTNYGAGCST
jgi:Flp pilus assembly protein TadG